MPRAKRQVVEDEPVVDEPQEDATVTGLVAEGIPEPAAEALAKRMGWLPKEEWSRDPEDWAPASQFLEKTATQVEDLRARNRKLQEEKERAARAAADAIEDERRRVREEALRTVRTADDPEERVRAATKLAENSGPPPETLAWMARNTWFDSDPDAQAMAVAAVNRMAARGASIPDQLAEAELAVRKRFPEHFATVTDQRPAEQRLSDVRRAAPIPPQVQQGSRAGTSQPRERGFGDIPAADRQAFRTNLLRHFMANGQTQEQAEARYARSYWRDPPADPSSRDAERFPMNPIRSDVWRKRG